MISLQGNIQLPASKSISHRVLMIKAMSKQLFEIENLSTANDTILLKKCLDSIQETNEVQLINVEDAGTPFRFLTAYLCTLQHKKFELTGNQRMNERPIKELVNVLQNLGATITYKFQNECPPLLIEGKNLCSTTVKINASESSQFISALCLIAPNLPNGLTIVLANNIVSSSYIIMTLEIMKEFGIDYLFNQNIITIKQQHYYAKKTTIENDWSSACFFYAMALIADEVDITLNKLNSNSVQGDSHIATLCKQFGIETIFENNDCIITKNKKTTTTISIPTTLNLSSYPDLAIPLIVACAIRYPSIKITGITHLAFKESNRIEALQTELKKVNIFLQYENDTLTFDNQLNNCVSKKLAFNSYNDHRIVMSLHLFSLLGFEITFDNTTCVKKSFPNYWNEVEKLNINF